MFLNEDKELFNDVIEAAKLQSRPITVVEKDYSWECL